MNKKKESKRNPIMAAWMFADHPAADRLAWFAALILCLATFVPFYPLMPEGGLDPSYLHGLNQAVAQGLSFGKEIVFTYGPFASIASKAYHPATDRLMIAGSLYLALSWWACLIFLMRGGKRMWGLILCVLFAGLTVERDPLLYSYPLLAGLAAVQACSVPGGWSARKGLLPLFAALLFAPLGLLPLVKGTYLVLCGAVAALCLFFFLANKRKDLAAICLLSPPAAMILCWLLSGQALQNLPAHFAGTAALTSGFNEAMALTGDAFEILLYLAAAGLLLTVIWLQKPCAVSVRLFLICLCSVFLFVAFKAGFVRHDGHAVIAGNSLLVAAISLRFLFNRRSILLAIALALGSWYNIDRHYVQTSPVRFAANVGSTCASAWRGVSIRMTDGTRLKREYDAANSFLKRGAPFPLLPGTADIYSYRQTNLLSTGNAWSPRPVFQSYHAYTRRLAEMNRRHLLGPRAPDHVFFRLETFDQRLPAMDDGPSWPVLLAGYQLIQSWPVEMAGYQLGVEQKGFLFLRKKAAACPDAEPYKIGEQTGVFGERIIVPESAGRVFARIDIRPTVAGRIAGLLFKPDQLWITLKMKTGGSKPYRIISGMTAAGFLLSPLVEDTGEFAALYSAGSELDRKQVASFSIEPLSGRTLFWKKKFRVVFESFPRPADGSRGPGGM